MKKRWTILLMIAAMLMGLVGCSGAPAEETPSDENEVVESPLVNSNSEVSGDKVMSEESFDVYINIKDKKISRYMTFDAPLIEKHLKEYLPNSTVYVLDAESDPNKQLEQCESAIANGADAYVLMAADPDMAGAQLLKLEEAGVFTITYAPNTNNGPVRCHVSMPFEEIAENYVAIMDEYMKNNDNAGEAFRVCYVGGKPGTNFYKALASVWEPALEAWEKEGRIEVVYKTDAGTWSASDAQSTMEQAIVAADYDIDIVVTMNDDIATGIIAALDAQNMTGKTILYGGCDAALDGVSRVLAGWQHGDVSPDFDKMGEAAAKVIAYGLTGQDAKIDEMVTSSFNNGYQDVPTVDIPSLIIDKDNFEEIVYDYLGLYERSAVEEVANGMGWDGNY